MPVRPLCPELAEKARLELNEDPNRTDKDLQHIKDWLAKQPHIRARTDDQWLVAFLRGCKFSLERTKEKLDLYYSLHTIAPELFRIKPKDGLFTEIINLGTYLVLPKPATPTSPMVTMIRPGTYDPEKYNIYDIFSVSLVIQRILLVENDTLTVAGGQTILDLEGVTMAHITQMTPAVLKRMAVLAQDALPVRMKGTHYINTPPGFETIFNAIKNLLNEKNRSRLHVHNKNYGELYKKIPQEILPAEYGGNAGTINEISGADFETKTMPVRSLTPALAEKARLELGEDPKILEENIRHLEQWILKQPHLRARTDEQWLAAFLRGCKHRMEQTKAKIDLYYSLRSTAPYLFSVKYFEPKFMDIINLGAILILPKTKNPADPRVVLYRMGQYDPKEHSILDIMAVLNLQEQICLMEDDNMVVSGTANVVDLGGTRWSHYTQTSLRYLRTLIQLNQDAMPKRIKSVHFLNAPRFFETFFNNIVKRFLNAKIKSRLTMHGKNIDVLHQHVSKEILPPEYGGSGDSIQHIAAYWKKKMRKYDSFLEEDLQYGSDEFKRNQKTQEIAAVDEPFRRLEID